VKAEIEALQRELLAAVADIGGMATNLTEARDWMQDMHAGEAKLSLEAVSAGAVDATERLRTIALKCEELCAGAAAKKGAGK
jgi:hypothetical protein